MSLTSQSPVIGIFDSGVGGLTVARAVLCELPAARLIYLADTAHVPYGPRPLAQVRDFALQIIGFLYEQGADIVVMGCNMSSASGARDAGIELYGKPLYEVIRPGAAAAQAATRNGRIGVIATQGTVNSGAYERALHATGVAQVYQQACPLFVPLVECGQDDGPEVDAAVAEYLTPLRDAGVDTLIFGCTHYPFLGDAIARFLGPEVTLIDPGTFTASEVAAQFATDQPPTPPDAHRFFSSGDPESLRREGERLLGFPLHKVEWVGVPVERPIV